MLPGAVFFKKKRYSLYRMSWFLGVGNLYGRRAMLIQQSAGNLYDDSGLGKNLHYVARETYKSGPAESCKNLKKWRRHLKKKQSG
jgi:hypothetical protein